jgi:undecaprenyl-diphosphatase
MKLLLSIHKYDVSMFTWLVNAKMHASLAQVCRYLSKTADGPLYVIVFAVLCFSEGLNSPILRAILLAFVLERPIYFVLKNGFKRHRPEDALNNFRSIIRPSDKFGLPSGHTSAAFMMATLLGYFIPALLIPLYCWAAMIGFSRVVLGVHFPTDTLLGVVLGVSAAIFSLGQVL